MGSIAPRPPDLEGRDLFLQLQRSMKQALARSGEIDLPAMIVIVDNTLDDLGKRDRVIHYLTAYLARTLSGTLPNPQDWLP